jgi:hypothetical protein
MWDSPLIAKFGIGDVPANVVIDQNGNIRDRNLSPQKLDELLDKMLKEEK